MVLILYSDVLVYPSEGATRGLHIKISNAATTRTDAPNIPPKLTSFRVPVPSPDSIGSGGGPVGNRAPPGGGVATGINDGLAADGIIGADGSIGADGAGIKG